MLPRRGAPDVVSADVVSADVVSTEPPSVDRRSPAAGRLAG